MTSERKPIVDLDPSYIGQISETDNEVHINFPRQTICGGGADGSSCSCSLVISSGEVLERNQPEGSRINHFELKFPWEARHCFLPLGFSIEGTVDYKAYSDDKLLIHVRGTAVELRVHRTTRERL